MSRFIHSEKVPKIYKAASFIAQLAQEKKQSVKELVFSQKYKHFNTKALYALIVETLQHASVLDQLLNESKVLIEDPGLKPWLARVLITELLWGKKTLPPNTSKPITTILNRHSSFVGILKGFVRDGTHSNEPRQNKALLKPRYVRVNTLLLSVGDALTEFRREGWTRGAPAAAGDYTAYLDSLANLGDGEFVQDFHVKEVFAFPPGTEFHGHELYTSGKLLLQDKATCLAAFLLDPAPGSRVLDMCAAPGLKTTQLAAIMKNIGTIYACEKNPARYKTLLAFIALHNATCVTPVNADATSLTPLECTDVTHVLVDPTCSGSGTITSQPVSPQRLQNLANFQTILLERALTVFPCVVRAVYSTCSVHEEENEQVVERVLEIVNKRGRRFELLDPPQVFSSRGSDKYECGKKCLLYGEADKTTGFFVAVFQRVADDDSVERTDGLGQRADKRKRRKKGKIGEDLAVDGKVGTENQCEDDVIVDSKEVKKKRKKKGKIDEECSRSDEVENGRGSRKNENAGHDVEGDLKDDVNREEKKKKKKRKAEEVDDNAEELEVDDIKGNNGIEKIEVEGDLQDDVGGQEKQKKKKKKKTK